MEFIEDNNFGILLTQNPDASVRTIVDLVNDDKALESIRSSMAAFVAKLNTGYFKDYAYAGKHNYSLGMYNDSRKIYSY